MRESNQKSNYYLDQKKQLLFSDKHRIKETFKSLFWQQLSKVLNNGLNVYLNIYMHKHGLHNFRISTFEPNDRNHWWECSFPLIAAAQLKSHHMQSLWTRHVQSRTFISSSLHHNICVCVKILNCYCLKLKLTRWKLATSSRNSLIHANY